MKELRNNIDAEVVFTELKEAKKWYLPKDNVLVLCQDLVQNKMRGSAS